eukprot:CAMPEP_0171835970 /NCGR_PEP_ID=MMETSP0992-20121227/11295_1 /TAXON_ID=483369 /ORGANISM="non described non described, Strain CCMP2098" /LENGTH=508 /DNA_ID=CAMNT_0012451885 /DNA_START=349 /DNA_END=1875 /DNA_ORIENTATION=+
METRSSPSVAVLHCLALTAGVPSFSTAPKPHLFHQLQEDFDMERLTRVYLREEKRQQTREDVDLESRHKRTRSLSPPPPPPSRSAVNSSSSSSSASSSSASPSSSSPSSPSSSCEEQTSAKKKKKAKREKPSKKAAAAKQPHTKLGEQQRRRVKSAHANTSSSLLNDDGGAVAKEEKKTKKHKQQQKTKKKKSAAISSPRALPPPPLEEEGHLLAPSSSSSSASKLSTEKQPPLVDPVMLTELGPHDPKWTFTRPNGQKVVYGALSLADYMLCSGDFTEPHTRVPFGDGDLSEIDALVALHSKSVLLRQRRLQGGVGEGEVEGVVQRGSVLKAKQTPSLFEEGRFRRDALNGLERCAGEVVAEVVWVMEACGQQTQTQTGQFGGGQGHGQAEYDAYGNHTGTVGGGSGGSGGGGGSSSGGSSSGSSSGHHGGSQAYLNVEEAQLRLVLSLFPSLADLHRQLRDADPTFARQCVASYALFVQGPPNRPTRDGGRLLPMVLTFLSELPSS